MKKAIAILLSFSLGICQVGYAAHSLQTNPHQKPIFIQATRILCKLITCKPLSKNEKKFAKKTAISLGLTVLGIGAIALYKQYYSIPSITLPANISIYDKRQHSNAIYTIINNQETAEKLWAESKSLPELADSIINSVNTKETYVFKDDYETLQGFITIQKNHICLLAVNKEYRSNGIGSQLLTFATNHLALTYNNITIDVEPENSGAKKLYERHGFQFESEPYAPGLLRGTKKVA